MKNERDYQVQQPPRMYQQVIAQLVAYIESEKMSEGAKLPTERNLSELLGVSRSSIREGIRGLELLGYLVSKQGEGTFVSTPPPFIIPSQLIKHQLNKLQLKNYYDVFIMCSEQIVSLSISHGLSYKDLSRNVSISNPPTNFWPEFCHWIKTIASHLKNPFFLSLWLTNYKILEDNNYFSILPSNLQLNALLDSYVEKNETIIKEFFHYLSNLNTITPQD